MSRIRTAIEHGLIGLVTLKTGLPVGSFLGLAKAIFGRDGPQSVQQLAITVESALQAEIESEYATIADLQSISASIEIILRDCSPNLEEIAKEYNLDAGSIADGILRRCPSQTVGLDNKSIALLKRMLNKIYSLFLSQDDIILQILTIAHQHILAESAGTQRDIESLTKEMERIRHQIDALRARSELVPLKISVPRPVDDYQGYEAERARIHEALVRHDGANISIIHGIGGAGKSELAKKIADEMHADLPDGQLLINMLRNPAAPLSVDDALAKVLSVLGVVGIRPEDLDTSYNRYLRDKRLLVVLDDVTSADGLARLVPPRPAALIITSRTNISLPGAVSVAINGISRVAAKRLLRTNVATLDEEASNEISELCFDLPMALRVVAAFLKEYHYPVSEYIEELRTHRLSELSRSATAIERPDLNLQVVLGYSYERLRQSDPSSARLFTFLGVFPAEFDVAGAASVTETSPVECRRTLHQLSRLSLLQCTSDNRYRLHDLLRELVNQRIDPADLQLANARFFDYYTERLIHYGADYCDARREVADGKLFVQRDYPNIRKALDGGFIDLLFQEIISPKLASAYQFLGNLLAGIGQHAQALNDTEFAAELFGKFAEGNRAAYLPSLVSCLNSRANRLDELGRHEEALAIDREAFERWEDWEDHTSEIYIKNRARILAGLGLRLNKVGHYEEAKDINEEAATLLLKLTRVDRNAHLHELASVLHFLSVSYSHLEMKLAALRAARRSVFYFRCLLKERRYFFLDFYARSITARGGVNESLHRDDKAFADFSEALVCYNELGGLWPDRYLNEKRMIFQNLSIILSKKRNFKEAFRFDLQALRISQNLVEKFGNDYCYDLGLGLSHIGVSLAYLGRYRFALQSIDAALEIYRKIDKSNSRSCKEEWSQCLNNRASVLGGLGRAVEARQDAEEALKMRRELFELSPIAYRKPLVESLMQLAVQCKNGKLVAREHQLLLEILREIVPLLEADLLRFRGWAEDSYLRYLELCRDTKFEVNEYVLRPVAELLEEKS